MRTRPNAFTLIELLIVVAIIAIMSGALLAVLIAPLKEQAATELRAEMQRGSMTFFANLTADLHGAEAIAISEDGTRLEATPLLDPETRILYFLSNDRVLRRWEGGASDLPGASNPTFGAPLVISVETLIFEQLPGEPPKIRTSLLARRDYMQQAWDETRSLTILLGDAWKGTAQ